jgi:hypothetical protein
VDALWNYVHSLQLSNETVGAFFKRIQQQYNVVQLTDRCDFGDVTRKTLALQGLKQGAYQEVLSPWVRKILIGQGKTRLATATMNELQSSVTGILTTSKFYKNNAIQPGKATSRARLANGTELSEPLARQVSDDKPCNNPMIESIVARLRNKRISALE